MRGNCCMLMVFIFTNGDDVSYGRLELAKVLFSMVRGLTLAHLTAYSMLMLYNNAYYCIK